MTSLADAMAARIPHGLDAGFPLDGLEQRARVLTAVREDLRGARSGRAVRRVAALRRRPLAGACRTAPRPKVLRGRPRLSCPDGVWRVARDRTAGPFAPGALDAPVLAAFLPALSRALLGEDLLAPVAASVVAAGPRRARAAGRQGATLVGPRWIRPGDDANPPRRPLNAKAHRATGPSRRRARAFHLGARSRFGQRHDAAAAQRRGGADIVQTEKAPLANS